MRPVPQPPTTDDREAWRVYWELLRQPWRSEPEIDEERKEFLEQRRRLQPDIKHGHYPFKAIEPRLTRADIEWLLATHQDGLGPVDWDDAKQRTRIGLDLRGSDLRGVDLSGLPLARLHGGLTEDERAGVTTRQRSLAAIHCEGVKLYEAHLEGAYLAGGNLEGADLERAHLEQASLMYAHLEGVNLRTARMEGAFLGFANLNGKTMDAQELQVIRQWKHDFPDKLHPANLRYAFFDNATILDSINLGDEVHGFVSVVDVRWCDVNLAMVNWEKIRMLGDESRIHSRNMGNLTDKERNELLRDYRRASRANRQLAIALQSQGLNEESAYFAYRAQVLQRRVLWLRRKYAQFVFSTFLYVLAGYGYRLTNSFLAYAMVIFAFAAAYFFIGHAVNLPLTPLEAVVFSMTSFHGRGFSPSQNIGLSSPLTILAAIEAFVGLLIEITLIATLTQRFFRR